MAWDAGDFADRTRKSLTTIDFPGRQPNVPRSLSVRDYDSALKIAEIWWFVAVPAAIIRARNRLWPGACGKQPARQEQAVQLPDVPEHDRPVAARSNSGVGSCFF